MVPEAIINICFCLLLLLFMLIATVTLLFLIKKDMNIAYAFSDLYQHVKSGQTVPKCIDIKYFYI